MLSIGSSQPVSWPSAPPPAAVAPVSAVPVVGAAQASARDGHADSGRNGQGTPGGSSAGASKSATDNAAAPKAAPLLPREHADDAASSVPADEAQRRAEQRQEEEQKAQEKAAQKLQLQEVLTTVWKASAAVVDVVLGREAALSAVAASDPAAVAGQAIQEPAPGNAAKLATRDTAKVVSLASARRDQEPVAYTEQGTSSWPPTETGSLLSRRV